MKLVKNTFLVKKLMEPITNIKINKTFSILISKFKFVILSGSIKYVISIAVANIAPP